MENGVIQAILNRKSIRSFTGESVDRAQLELIVRAAMAAPSAMNSQPWAYVVVDDRVKLDALADVLPYAKMLKSAGAAIIICGDMSKVLPAPMTDFWVQDCSAATQNVLLAVESLGLGAVWTGVHPVANTENAVKSVIAMPDNFVPFCVIPVGHPAGNTPAKDKFDATKIHWNQW